MIFFPNVNFSLYVHLSTPCLFASLYGTIHPREREIRGKREEKREKDRQTDRQTGRQTHRQTERKKRRDRKKEGEEEERESENVADGEREREREEFLSLFQHHISILFELQIIFIPLSPITFPYPLYYSLITDYSYLRMRRISYVVCWRERCLTDWGVVPLVRWK